MAPAASRTAPNPMSANQLEGHGANPGQGDLARAAQASGLSGPALTAGNVANAQVVAKSPLISSGPNSYSYAPSAMYDASDGKYKVWFGGNNSTGSGDGIFFAESNSPNGPWSKPQQVFAPEAGKFDQQDACDPSVVKGANGTYYMYYGAASHDSAASNGNKAWTSIGVATSPDGIHWSPGKQIVTPQNPNSPTYGAGQPSVVRDGNQFYMLYTDTSADGSQGQLYALRSSDPTFQSNVQNYNKATGQWVTDSPAHRIPLGPGADTDWALDHGKFVSASTGAGRLQLNTDLLGNSAGVNTSVSLAGDSALVRNADGSLLNQNGNINVIGAVNDPSKANNPKIAENAAWEQSLQNFTLRLNG